MARKETTITLMDRGNELTFHIKEMPATHLESWLMRALLLLASSGALPPTGAGLAESAGFIRANGLQALAGVDYAEAKPLLDELLTCCTRVTESGVRQQVSPATLDGYIEDVATLFTLRLEVIQLHLDFFPEDGASALATTTQDPKEDPKHHPQHHQMNHTPASHTQAPSTPSASCQNNGSGLPAINIGRPRPSSPLTPTSQA